MTRKKNRNLQLFTLIYAALYILFLVSGFIGGDYNTISAETVGVYLLFAIFLTGMIYSWFNGIVTGILFLVWNIGMWIIELFFVTQGGGFGIISGVPLLVLGVFHALDGYRNRVEPDMTSDREWRLVLRWLLISYTLLYMVWIARDILGLHGFSSIIQNPSASAFFFSILGLYLAGVILSWYREAIAGALFIAWYLSLLIGSMPFHIEYNSTGPLLLFGLPILLQGILYLVYYFSFNISPIEKSVEDVKN